jgi:hypothetical protein
MQFDENTVKLENGIEAVALFDALDAIANWPILHADNLDAVNIRSFAERALTKMSLADHEIHAD